MQVFSIRTFRKLHSVPLVEEMRYPSGDVSGDGHHLVVPGKLANDNSPAVSVWTLGTRTTAISPSPSKESCYRQRFLVPNEALCPFRCEATITKKL